MVKKILKIALWVITGVALVALFIFGRRWYLDTPLKGITFTLERGRSQGFVEKDSVLAYAEAVCNTKQHANIGSVDLIRIQKVLADNPWVEHASAFIGLDDTLVIRAKEFEPVLRVYNQEHRSVYVTADGVIVPSSPNYTPHLLIASGDFTFPIPRQRGYATDSVYANTGIMESVTIAKAILTDPFLTDNIGQIYKNQRHEFELAVNNVTARVLLGDTTAVNNKLERLKIMLERFGGSEEMEPYKTIDLKYNKQIVCTKK